MMMISSLGERNNKQQMHKLSATMRVTQKAAVDGKRRGRASSSHASKAPLAAAPDSAKRSKPAENRY